MDSLIFPDHVRIRMAQRRILEVAVYHVVEDADEIVERDDGRTEYTGVCEGRALMVVVEDDGETVVTVFERKQRRPRRR